MQINCKYVRTVVQMPTTRSYEQIIVYLARLTTRLQILSWSYGKRNGTSGKSEHTCQ